MLEQADKSSETKIYEGLFNKVLFISELESRLRLWPPQKKSKLKVNRIFYNFPRIKKKTKPPFLYISDFLKVALLLNDIYIKIGKIIPEKNDANLHDSHRGPICVTLNVKNILMIKRRQHIIYLCVMIYKT